MSLLVLLALVAIGLLSLSTVTLRSTGQEKAMTEARANARMALMLALGELQKHAGPDQAATAPVEILPSSASSPRLTGVWSSWDPLEGGGSTAPDYDGAKRDRFRAWLVSDPDAAAVEELDYAGPQDETVELVGKGTLGTASPDPKDVVTAGKVRVTAAGGTEGTFAWHVSDESQKARINAYRNPAATDFTWRKSSLMAGHRPNASVMTAAGGEDLSFLPGDTTAAEFNASSELSGKLATLGQFELLPPGQSMGPFYHQVTPYSYGLLTNVREGGLKQDLSSMFEGPASSLPLPYRGERLYASTHENTGPTDPYWSALQSYYSVFKDPAMSTSSPVYFKPPPESVDLSDTERVPQTFYAAPVIARVEMIFSVVVRESHGPWSANSTKMKDHTRMVHLLYAPVITLHNPYNVSLKFEKMDIDINGIPVAFNFFVNGLAQNNRTVPYNQMYVQLANRAQKSFNLSISDWSSPNSDSPGTITMLPGQSLVCGPYIDGSAIFGNAGHEGSRVFFDYRNALTGSANARAKCKPGFLGKQVAFDVDWITPDNGPNSTDGRRGVLIVKPTDRFHIEYEMKPNEFNNTSTNTMSVSASLNYRGRTYSIGGLQFDFDAPSLDRIEPTVYRYPDVRSVPNELLVERLWEPNLTPIRDHVRVEPFALVTARARTINGGVYETGDRQRQPNAKNILNDGNLAGIPFLHHNPVRSPTVVDLKRDQPGRYSHELSLQPLQGSVDDLYDIDATHRGYLLTGNNKASGIKSGSYLELPTAPLQTIADFRRSNALTSTRLPNFVQPVANSYPSPLISPSRHTQTGVVDYALLDHSFLANQALYDRFYFSTFATYSSTTTPDKAFEGFLEGSLPLAAQSFVPYLPSGTTIERAKGELFDGSIPGDSAYLRASAFQLTRCPFNVNSVDVEAWKAVLSSMSNTEVQLLWAATANREGRQAEDSPLVPMALVNGGEVGQFNPLADSAKIDDEKTNDFNGYHQLDSAQLDELARRIVEQVRLRGPFLSLAEFVNRRLEDTSDQGQAGALQTAIDESGINDALLAGQVVPIEEPDISDPATYGFANPIASTGNPAAGAPGWLMQGDLMRMLEPGATVRGDTFVIRTCGESLRANGEVAARAYAEAVVQRFPEYVDPSDDPSTNVWDQSAGDESAMNKRFGRRFEVTSFRWLSPEEI